jgi:hypothetical protein
MKASVSLDNNLVEQLLFYTQTKTAKDGILKALQEYIRYQQRQELLNCRGAFEIEDSLKIIDVVDVLPRNKVYQRR